MSVQLILYPQSYDGTSNPLSGINNEFVSNGISFTGLNSVSSYDSSAANIPLDVLTNQPPSIINTWYRFRSTSAGTPSLPTVTSGNLVLNSTTTTTLSGIYQRLSNLTVGQQYTFTINISTPAANGNVVVSAFNGTSVLTQQSFAASLTQITHSFTATSTDNTIMISYFNGVANNVTISSISVQPSAVAASGAIQLLDNGQVICDLYEDEDIPLTLSVDDFKNVAEQIQSYSKAFNLPATKRNNLIFNQMYEITRSDDGIIFNPYVKTKCVLKQDGFLLFEGYMRMIDISDKEGEISYNVNLYSEVTALADVLKDRTFSDLDFAELTHDYTYANIRNSWQGILALTNPLQAGTFAGTVGASTTGVLKYPFVDWNHQFPVSSLGNPQLPNLESAFRPWVNMKYLVDMIFDAPDTPFTYTSSFLDGSEFNDLYMDFNWGSENTPVEIDITTFNGFYVPTYTTSGGFNYATTTYSVMELSPQPIPFIGGATPPNYNDTTKIITSTVVNENYDIDYTYSIENIDTVDRTIECQWLYNSTPINSSGVQTLAANGGTYNYTGNFNQIMLNVGDTLQVQFRTNTGTASKVRQADCSGLLCSTANVVFNVNAEAVTTNTILQTLRGELGQWEFLKGIMTLFNLVTLVDPDNPNNLLIETYGDVFITGTGAGTTLASRGISHDWTDKIDVSQMKLEPLTDLNKKTIFKFLEDDDDFCFRRYKEQVGGHLYGSKEWDATAFTVLTGEEEIIAEPFAATVCAPLMPQYSDFLIPKMYASSDDETEGFENSPRIMYTNGVHDLTSCTYSVPAQNGVAGDAFEDEYLRFSHLSEVPTLSNTTDFNFGECQLAQGLGNSPTRNMFNTFWLPYYAELYNPNTRTMTIKVALTPGDIATFKFNDNVMIKNREFRVNKIDYKPNDLATVEFILIG
tara:strand:+ start:220 stop:2973 length:2754 start_codon:yes stop_codon:yes gene_type:complete